MLQSCCFCRVYFSCGERHGKHGTWFEYAEYLGESVRRVRPEIQGLNTENFVELVVGEGKSGQITVVQCDLPRFDGPGVTTAGGTHHLLREIDPGYMPIGGLGCNEFNGLASSEAKLQYLILRLDI